MRKTPRILAMSVLTSYAVILSMINVERPTIEAAEANVYTAKVVDIVYIQPIVNAKDDIITIEDEPVVKKEKYTTGWTTDSVNVRKKPNTKSDILDTYSFNTKIQYTDYDGEWAKIKFKDGYAYMHKNYISKKKNRYKEYSVPETSGFKSFMSYKAITSKSSPQYKLQHEKAYTGKNGIRQVGDRYCVAIGSYFTNEIGALFDLVLENGTVIPCILADQKADKDTDSQNIITRHNGCLSEFIVDVGNLKREIARMGDVSYFNNNWDSPVESIRVYE